MYATMIMTLRVKQKMKNRKISHKLAVPILALTAVLAAGFIITPLVQADRFEEQIRAINEDTANRSQTRMQLGSEAASLTDAINKLQAEINDLQSKIAANQTKNEEVRLQIIAAEEELARQKKLLGENIKAMYLEGQITTLEMLASSKDLSEFVDKQQYRDAVKDKIKSTLDKVTALKAQLKTQKETLEKLIADQETMKQQVVVIQGEHHRILGMNQEQQAVLNAQISNNNRVVGELRKQQAIENARLFGGGAIIKTSRCDIYPQGWCMAPMDSIVDTWGMYNRECVSWTAYRVAASGRYMPYWGGYGNANQWDDNAIAEGIPVDRSPRVGDVAVSNSGYYGHVMYVEAVFDDGTIAVSQFNHDWGGTYSYVPKMGIGNLVFIHF